MAAPRRITPESPENLPKTKELLLNVAKVESKKQKPRQHVLQYDQQQKTQQQHSTETEISAAQNTVTGLSKERG